ncbi:hypothetical protein M885DRAFT_329652 [Pelagophyceae sp. CCMP2097]|nr:hypothetical protein M885DRAFT_329652 [Pelagophyceae sp. CCMP2097]
MSRADAAALDIFGRCGACVDGGALVDWARTRANCSGKAWIFDVLEPKRVEASLKHFPVHRRLAADPAAMSDDEEDEEDEEEEDEDRAALVYDPRFVLAALAATLALPSAGDEVNAGRRAYESGALSYAVAALASNHEDVRALAGGVVARCAAALGEAQDERGFGARASVVALLAALVAGVALRAAGDAAAGGRAGPHVPRVPALTASLAARALLSLAAPGVEGFVAAHSFALRRALLDLWRLPFCLREALSTRDAWALTCAADSARDDDDARLARNGRFLPQLIARRRARKRPGVTEPRAAAQRLCQWGTERAPFRPPP